MHFFQHALKKDKPVGRSNRRTRTKTLEGNEELLIPTV
jgi:hypothetical protein